MLHKIFLLRIFSPNFNYLHCTFLNESTNPKNSLPVLQRFQVRGTYTFSTYWKLPTFVSCTFPPQRRNLTTITLFISLRQHTLERGFIIRLGVELMATGKLMKLFTLFSTVLRHLIHRTTAAAAYARIHHLAQRSKPGLNAEMVFNINLFGLRSRSVQRS